MCSVLKLHCKIIMYVTAVGLILSFKNCMAMLMLCKEMKAEVYGILHPRYLEMGTFQQLWLAYPC